MLKVEERFHDQQVFCNTRCPRQGFKGVVAMIEHPEKKNDVELAYSLGGDVCDVNLLRVDIEGERPARELKRFAPLKNRMCPAI